MGVSAETFDPNGYYDFDLAHGAVHAQAEQKERVVVIPDTTFASLVGLAAEAGRKDTLEELGRALGRRAGAIGDRSPESVLHHAAATVALFGWGRLGLERWGDALAVPLDGPPALPEVVLEALLNGMFAEMSGQSVACVSTGNAQYLLLHPDVAGQARTWLSEGLGLAGVVDRLRSAQ